MITYERIYHEYQADLADAVLPGDDHLARERRAALSEMLVGMMKVGVEVTLYTVGDRLSTFVPQYVAESTGDWKERHMKRWTEQFRPEIFQALGDYFIEGGHEKRSQAQQKLLDSLVASGIRIEGRNVLDAVLPWSGDWKKRLLALAMMGRPHGVRLFRRDDLSVPGIRSAMREVGFTDSEVHYFVAGLV